MKKKLLLPAYLFINKYRMSVSFTLNLLFILIVHTIFTKLQPDTFTNFKLLIKTEYAPEVWFALLALVLGTLIIVISVASQNIPKLIDLYMRDWFSLIYVWFIIISTCHILIIYDYNSPAHFLNINILLMTSALIAFPYIFYILRLTKPDVIIHRIHENALTEIRILKQKHESIYQSVHKIEKDQRRLLNSLNQLDALLNFINFKDNKLKILTVLKNVLEFYILHKNEIATPLFRTTQTLRNDPAFSTMHEFFKGNQSYPLFYEKKCFRILGSAYSNYIDQNQYDLASFCASQFCQIGKIAVDQKNEPVIEMTLVHMNTLFRFAFKHSLKHQELRNLYNLVYHYRLFMEKFVYKEELNILEKTFFYLQYYAHECYKNAKVFNLYFIVDTIAFEMQNILKAVYLTGVDDDRQKSLLKYFLEIDRPPEVLNSNIIEEYVMTSKVRIIQIGMGLFYLEHDQKQLCGMIIDDILEDKKLLGIKTFTKVIEKILYLLENAKEMFWEDTERGNFNIYYSKHLDKLEEFKEEFYKKGRI